MAPRRRSSSVESRWRPERRLSKDRDRRRSTSRPHQRDRSPAPNSRRERDSFNTSRRPDYSTARDSSRDRPRHRSRDRSSSTSSRRAPKTDVYRPETGVGSRRREVSISSTKRRRELSPSPYPDRSRKHRRQGSFNTDRSRSITRRDERPRRLSPDSYIPRHRSRSRESVRRRPIRERSPSRDRRSTRFESPRRTSKPFDKHSSQREPSRKHRDSERWERGSIESEAGGHRRREPFGPGPGVADRELRSAFRRRSVSRDSRRRSPEFRRPSSPIEKRHFTGRDSARDERYSHVSRGSARRPFSPRRRSPPPLSSKSRHTREDSEERRGDKERGHNRHSSRSPAGYRSVHPRRKDRDDKERNRSRSRERFVRRDGSKTRRRGSPSQRSTTPVSDRDRDGDKMSWRPYDNRGAPPPRGGWPAHDPRYSHSPPYHPGYQGSPHGAHPQAYSPQASPYPPPVGQPDRGYFHPQQSPPFNHPSSHHQSPSYQHGTSPQQPPNGSYIPRGGYRGSQPSYTQRFDQRFAQPPSAQTPGPHVRNLSWTPKTGTRGGHAPTVHGATQQANVESSTPTTEQPNIFNGTDNPFRPASKDLRVDDEAGKTGKSQSLEQQSTVKTASDGAQQHSPQIRFGLPKTGAAAPAAKPNAFETKRNPFEQAVNGTSTSTTNDRYGSRQAPPQYDSRPNRETDWRREEYPPRPKGLKPAIKLADRTRFHDRRKSAPPVHWGQLPQSFGDKELRKKLGRLRSLVLSKGHSLKDLHWTVLRPRSEPADDDDPPGLVAAIENKAILEEEAYREHPKKRPKGKLPLLRSGEVLEQIFKKDVIAIKYKVRRPQKVLPEEYRTSNVYYRKPGNESVVGFGTYGKVFKAKHIYKGKDVALKRLRMEAEKDGFPITAMREMKILKHLEQREAEGVIRLLEVLYEVNIAGSVGCFMAFEYMPHDLTGLLNHPTFSLSEAQRKDLSFQMVDAIGFMHKQGVLHRDIKAANILVSHKGQIKLADFGLARFYDMDRQLHYTNRVVTIWYRAPELLYGQTEYGPPIDVWAAACVIVEIFTKHAIFPGSGRELNQLLKLWEVLGFPTVEEWPAVSKTEWYFMMRPKEDMHNQFKEKYQHRISPELFNLLSDMLRYDPEKRPTCEECLQHPFFTTEEPRRGRVIELEELGDWHELESKRARKQREADERAKKDLEHDFNFGPPSCGQLVRDSRRDKDYRKDRLSRQDKRTANFSPIEPEAKKVKA